MDLVYNTKLYDENRIIIDKIINQAQTKWQLTALAWIDFEDVAQIIRIHIYKKIHLWDKERKIGPWLHSLVRNQIVNLLRNYHGSVSKPCNSCAAYQGDESCRIYSKIGDSCPLFSYWQKNKMNA